MTAARQPQQERSRATRERLLDECIDMLATQGWSATTVAAVAEAAGVSRAGPQHHFPTRESLITAVMEQMFETMTADASVVLADVPDDLDTRVNAVVDKAVAIYTGTQFKAALQVWAAAAGPGVAGSHPAVGAKLARAAHRFTVAGLDPAGVHPDAHRLAQVTLDPRARAWPG